MPLSPFSPLGAMNRRRKVGITYILRDDFTTAQAAPLGASRVCEPGPGTLSINDADGVLSIAGGRLSGQPLSGRTTPGVAGVTTALVAGQIGLAAKIVARFPTTATRTIFGFGPSANINVGFFLNTSRVISVILGGTQIGITGVLSVQDYEFLCVQASADRTRFLFLYRAVGDAAWVLAWVHTQASGGNYLFAYGTNFSNSNLDLDSFRVLDLAPLDSRFANDFGLATSRLAGSVSAGATFTHSADFVMEWTQTTIPTSGWNELYFSKPDAVNGWYIRITNLGDMYLLENGQNRAYSNAGLVAGHRIVVTRDGAVIRVYSNNVLRITYSTASSYTTATSGEWKRTGGATTGSINDLITYPRTITLPDV